MLAPREIGQEGFREGKVVETALKTLLEVGKELESKIAVFVSPPELAQNRANKAAVKDFLTSVRKKFDRVIWEAPLTWDADEAAALAADVKVIAARDPLAPRSHRRAGRVLPPRRPRGSQEPLRGPGDREARGARAGREAQGRDVRVHERRHVRRREALQEGDEAALVLLGTSGPPCGDLRSPMWGPPVPSSLRDEPPQARIGAARRPACAAHAVSRDQPASERSRDLTVEGSQPRAS